MRNSSPWSVQSIIDRIEREKQQTADAEPVADHFTTVGYPVCGLGPCHTDPGKLTVAQAHTAMQSHLECGVDTCRVRGRARNTLVAAGCMVLDPRATRAREKAWPALSVLLRLAIFGCGAMLLGGRHALR
ncbi:hypothetical protein [Nocardia concava]|uniref:hypothetical protein n=1 Tax=Nocardia concava TaxID=257281 RepID=UPI0002EA7FFB|nr:hypothetical protein [Nocardia concava]